MRILFIHRSVGQQFIDQLTPEMLVGSITLHDFNANFQRLCDSKTQDQLQTSINVPYGNTDPGGLAEFARASLDSPTMRAEIGSYDGLILKSCYSASAIKSDEALGQAKDDLRLAIVRFREIQPKLAIQYTTPPPRRRWLTSDADSRRATRFCEWASSELKRMGVGVIDLHSLLAEDAVLAKSYCRRLPFDQHPNSLGTEKGLALICSRINKMSS